MPLGRWLSAAFLANRRRLCPALCLGRRSLPLRWRFVPSFRLGRLRRPLRSWFVLAFRLSRRYLALRRRLRPLLLWWRRNLSFRRTLILLLLLRWRLWPTRRFVRLAGLGRFDATLLNGWLIELLRLLPWALEWSVRLRRLSRALGGRLRASATLPFRRI